MVVVGFHTSVTVFTELLGVVLGANHTVFLPIAEALVFTAFRVVVNLVTAVEQGNKLVLVAFAEFFA